MSSQDLQGEVATGPARRENAAPSGSTLLEERSGPHAGLALELGLAADQRRRSELRERMQRRLNRIYRWEQRARQGLAFFLILATPYVAILMLAALLWEQSGRRQMTDPLEGTVVRLAINTMTPLLVVAILLCFLAALGAGWLWRSELARCRKRAIDVRLPRIKGGP